MTCSPFDLRDYFLEELTDPEQRQVEAHVKTCEPCREELDRLRVTQSALFAIRDEEIPQRIAFVSDKIFEPSPWRRWWAGFWGSASRLGFASAAMLSTAILVYALHPVNAPAPPQAIAAVVAPPAPVVQTVSEAEIQARIDNAVAKAFAQSEERQEVRVKALVSQVQSLRQGMLIAANELEFAERKSKIYQASQYGGPNEQVRQ